MYSEAARALHARRGSLQTSLSSRLALALALRGRRWAPSKLCQRTAHPYLRAKRELRAAETVMSSILLACLAAAQGARVEPVKIACFGDSVTAGTATNIVPSSSFVGHKLLFFLFAKTCCCARRGEAQGRGRAVQDPSVPMPTSRISKKTGFLRTCRRANSASTALHWPTTHHGAASNCAAAASTSATVHSCIDCTQTLLQQAAQKLS